MNLKFSDFNPDCFVDASEAESVYYELQKGKAAEFFERNDGDSIETRIAYEVILNYCHHKARAMRLREAGKIAEAQDHERLCDKIYESLPESARW